MSRVVLTAMVLLALGCGGAKSATATSSESPSEARLQLAEAPAGTAPAAAPGTATVTGYVGLQGTAPTGTKVKMEADPVCQQQHAGGLVDEAVLVRNGKLANVFVYVKEGLGGKSFPAPTTPATLDQRGCWYTPHVIGVQAGQPLELVNSDATLHNVNAKPTVNQPFNVAQPKQGMKTTKSFAKPEVMVKVKCNVHPWMHAYVGVVNHPFYAVTGEEGTFTLAGLPAGTYTIEAWHETLGTQTQSVTVGDGETKTVSFTFQSP
ncbi:MAG: carboxypeptidase regulatory-like domain-containing protein [Candidatus Omnitrophica bacterium]|nr:carboxypeptidase regulatory-like domain-containing protein [Candidatus Omnitrophota bacterium]